MTERSVSEFVDALLAGEVEIGDVQLPEAVAVAEALADGEHLELLGQHAERVLPRLVKRERVDEIEGIWLACCTTGVMPLPPLLRTAERLVARGLEAQASDLLATLIGALLEGGRGEDALAVAQAALGWTVSPALLDAAEQTLGALFSDEAGLQAARRRLRAAGRAEVAEALRQSLRALRFAPGTFLRWIDQTVAQVVSTDGLAALVRHPSGVTERRGVDDEPPPKVLSAEAHEVLRLFRPEELRARWASSPTDCLRSLLEEQDGFVAVPGLKTILVPRVLDEGAFDEALAALKVECGLGREDRPSYDPRRRLFLAPGRQAPAPARKSAAPRAERPKERPAEVHHRPPPSSAPVVASAEQPRWVDLTQLPEIRELISRVEDEVGELTRELNVELPVRLEEARAHGDLRENAEYDAAKDRLRFVQARVGQLHDWLGQLHELSRVRLVPGHITAMSEVLVAEDGGGPERRLRLVPAELPEPRQGDVSIGTPYGKALLGREVGDLVTVRLPRRTERLEVLKVTDPCEG